MDKPKRLWLLFVLGVPAVCCLGGGFALMLAARSAHVHVEQERTEARRLGMPLSLAEMSLPNVPEAENAAPLYLHAHMLLNGQYKSEQGLVAKAMGREAKPADLAAGTEALTTLSPVLDPLSELSQRPACNFNRYWSLGPGLTFPELVDMKSIVRDLCLKADTQDGGGDWKSALQSMRTAYRVAQDSGSDPILIGLLVQVACRSIANAEYEKLIGRHTRDRSFLDAADAQIRAERALPSLRRAMAGEVAFGIVGLHSVRTLRQPDYSNDGSEPPKPSGPEKSFYASAAVQDSLEGAFLTKWMVAWREFPRDDDDWAGFGAALKDMDKAVEADKSVSNLVNQSMLPSVSGIGDVVGTLQANERLLLVSISLLESRLKTGRLPVVLPDSLGDLRIDPFDGNPLRYRIDGGGFILYSIGRDRIDNGGHKRSPTDTGNSGFDIVEEFS